MKYFGLLMVLLLFGFDSLAYAAPGVKINTPRNNTFYSGTTNYIIFNATVESANTVLNRTIYNISFFYNGTYENDTFENGTQGGSDTFLCLGRNASGAYNATYINELSRKNDTYNCSAYLAPGNWTITAISYSTADENFTNITFNVSVSYNVIVDNKTPSIIFGNATELNNSIFNRNWFVINVTLIEINFANITFYLFNASSGLILNETTFSNLTLSINYSISEGRYAYNVSVKDMVGNGNQTETRIAVIDYSLPIIGYSRGTEISGAYFNRTWIFVNVSVTEPNFKNISFFLYYENRTLATQHNFTTQNYTNFTGLQDGRYFYNVSVYDLASNYQYLSAREITFESSPSNATAGSTFVIGSSNDNLEFNETISDSQSYITKVHLTHLGDGIIQNEYGTFIYSTLIDLPNKTRMLYTSDPDDTSSVVKPFILAPNSARVFRYYIQFSPDLKSDHSTDGNKLEDIIGQKIQIGNENFTIVRAYHPTTENIILKLARGNVSDVLEESTSKTYTYRGKLYDVTVDFVSSATARFTVNNETSPSLVEGGNFTLYDGIELGLIDILEQQFAGGVRKVQFYLTKDRIQINDTNTTINNNGVIKVNTETMAQLSGDVYISSDGGINNGDDISISAIEFKYIAGDYLYVSESGSFSQVADSEEYQSGHFLAGSFDFKFNGLQRPVNETVRLQPSTITNYKLQWTNKANVTYDTEIFARNASNSIHLGRFSGSTMYDIVTSENSTIEDEEYIIVFANNYSRILQFKDINPTDNLVKIRDTGSGDLYDVSYSDSNLTGALSLDGNTYRVNLTSDANSATIYIDMNGDGDLVDEHNPEIWTQYGLRITLNAWAGSNDGIKNENQINFTTEEREESLLPSRDIWIVNITENSAGEIDLVNRLFSAESGRYSPALALQLSRDNSNTSVAYTGYGAYLEMDNATQNTFTVIYPDTQIFGTLSVVIPDTVFPEIKTLSTSNDASTVTLSATTNEDGSCRFDETNKSFENLAYVMTPTGTSHTGSRTYSSTTSGNYYIRCNDTDGNIMSYSNTTSFSIAIPVSSGGGGSGGSSGGGGGGGGAGGATGSSSTGIKSERFYDVVQSDTPVSFQVKNDELAVVNVEFETNTRSEKVNIIVEKISESKVLVKLENVVQYLNLSTTNLEGRVKTAAIEFKVSKRWLTENSISSEDIMMKRFNNNAWQDLQTFVISESSFDYTYEAITRGFSIFAITAERSQLSEKQIISNESAIEIVSATITEAKEANEQNLSNQGAITGAVVTPLAQDSRNKGLIAIIGLALLTGFITLYLYYKNYRRKK